MKMHVRFHALLFAATAALIPTASADPILPYQQPIAQQLMSDITAGTGKQATLNKALNAYHKTSRSLSGDITILKNLNDLLAAEPNYPALLANAALAYQNDFDGQSDALAEQLRPAPRGKIKTSAQTQLAKLNKALSNAAIATTTSARIADLKSAAAKIMTSSNTIQRALKAPVALSSMVARIGNLPFQSTRGFITGGTNFESGIGTTIGDFSPSNGVLTVSAIDNGNIVRGLQLHVEGIGTNAPATYPLGMGHNTAFYDATDVARRREYHFRVDASLTNASAPEAFLAIDYIGFNYLLGRFAFIGTNMLPISAKDTNTTVTVSRGDFQLNFFRPVATTNAP